MDSNISRETFTLGFDGGHEMDAALLGHVLTDLSIVVEELGHDSKQYDGCFIRVQAFQPGSFRVVLTGLMIVASQLHMLPPVGELASIFSIIKGMFEVKRFLAGRRPQNEGVITPEGRLRLESPDGGSLDVPWPCKIVITNPKVDTSMSNVATAAIQHNPTGAMRLIGDKESRVFPAADLERIASPLGTAAEEQQVQEWEVRVRLPIRKLDLIGKSQWSFDYQGRVISAAIEDTMFLARVHNGLNAYRSGDSLDVTLKTQLTTNADGTPAGERYFITEVHNPAPTD